MPVEGEIFYLFRPEDRRVLRTFAAQSAPLTFVDASRFLVTGQASLTVVDATSGAIREKLDGLGDSFSKALRASDGRRVFIGEDNSPSLLILEPEDRSCSPPLAGLAQFYSGDGTFEDTASVTELTPQGNVSFVPGKIGQAFYLDGNASLDGPRTADYAFGVQDSTLALYVKLGVGNREMTIMDRRMTSWAGVFALRTSGDNRFLFEAATPTGPLTLVGKNPAIEDHWYHLAVTLAGREFSLYIDGELQHQLSLTSLTSFVTEGRDTIGRLHFGAGNGGRAPFNGWLDEITFYNRALSREEIKKLYESREYGPCAMTGKSQ
jgi:hypothetical protein